MVLSALLLSGFLLAAPDTALVPGLCTAPASENVGKPGCYLSAQLDIAAPPAQLYWHIHQFDDEGVARHEAARHGSSTVVRAHDRVWLYVIGGQDERVEGGRRVAVIGPLDTPAGQPVKARFMESWFPPGMRTRVHAHPGPEAFYVVDGVQCVETPADRRKIAAGASYIVSGPHIQAAPTGRRNLVIILVPAGAPWMALDAGWTPSDFCDR